MTLGIGLLVPSRATRRMGVVLSAALHYAIAITPHPNQVAAFGVFCVTRLFFALPDAWTAALRESLLPPSTRLEAAVKFGGLLLVGVSPIFTSTPGVTIDWCIPAQTALCLIGARAVVLDAATTSSASSSATSSATKPLAVPTSTVEDGLPPPRSSRRALLTASRRALLATTIFYVFVAQPLGLMDISATSPFSHIRQHGGSNHLLLPTSLLQQSQAVASRVEAFGGGVARVTRCTSGYMNALYPAAVTAELQPRIVQLLTQAGHIAQQYCPTVHQMLGHEIRSHIPHWTPQSADPFPAYTLPGMQLRRMLAEARARNESFELEYDVLPGVLGDEQWRRHAVARHVSLSEDPPSGRSRCRVKAPGSLLWSDCAPGGEIANQPPLTGWLSRLVMKILLPFPYPVLGLEGVDELPCID